MYKVTGKITLLVDAETLDDAKTAFQQMPIEVEGFAPGRILIEVDPADATEVE